MRYGDTEDNPIITVQPNNLNRLGDYDGEALFEDWLQKFERCTREVDRQTQSARKMDLFASKLMGPADEYLVSLSEDTTRTYDTLIALFQARFPTRREGEVLLWTRQRLATTETVERFDTRLMRYERHAMGKGALTEVGRKQVVESFIYGLQSAYRDRLLDKIPLPMEEAIQKAKF